MFPLIRFDLHLEYKVSTAVTISEGKEHPSTFNLRLLEKHFFTLSPNFIKKKKENKERPKHLQTQNINSYSRTVWRVHACIGGAHYKGTPYACTHNASECTQMSRTLAYLPLEKVDHRHKAVSSRPPTQSSTSLHGPVLL